MCSTYTDSGYKAAKQHMANSGKDAALPGVYAYLYGREKFKLKVLDFRAWMSQFSVLHSRFNVFGSDT